MITKRRTFLPETRPCHGVPADWMTLEGPYARGYKVHSDVHNRVEVIEQESGVLLRFHDCGHMTRRNYGKPVIERLEDGSMGRLLARAADPVPFALARLDKSACEPLGETMLPLPAVGQHG